MDGGAPRERERLCSGAASALWCRGARAGVFFGVISRYSFWQVGVARVCMLGETMVDERNMNVSTPKSIVWTHRYLQCQVRSLL